MVDYDGYRISYFIELVTDTQKPIQILSDRVVIIPPALFS